MEMRTCSFTQLLMMIMTTTLGLYQCLPSNANPASIRVHILNGKSDVLKIIYHDNVVGYVNVYVCVMYENLRIFLFGLQGMRNF